MDLWAVMTWDSARQRADGEARKPRQTSRSPALELRGRACRSSPMLTALTHRVSVLEDQLEDETERHMTLNHQERLDSAGNSTSGSEAG